MKNGTDTESLVPDLRPGMEASLFGFVFHCTEYGTPGVDAFTAGNFKVEWCRPTYSGDREGMDRFVVYVGGQEVGDEPMFGEVDDDALNRIAALSASDMDAEQIIGIVS